MSLPVLQHLPDGYVLRTGARRGGLLVVREADEEALRSAGYGADTDGSLSLSSHAGRRPLFELFTGKERLLLRRFSHGGLLRWATGERFLDAERPFRELLLSLELRRRSIATPEVVAARARPRRGFGWQLEVMTREVQGALDLGRLLGQMQKGERTLAPPARARVLEGLGAFLRRAHDAGLRHVDLNPKNLLVERSALEAGSSAAPRFWVLDLDRSSLMPSLPTALRHGSLSRLYRNVERREREGGVMLSRVDRARLVRAYCAPDPWRDTWRGIALLHLRAQGLHRLGWMLERSFASDDEPPGPAPGSSPSSEPSAAPGPRSHSASR